jgi:hypothetical protein
MEVIVMAEYFELDFLPVETKKSGDAITIRYSVNGAPPAVHVIDGGYIDTGDQIIDHIQKFYGTTTIDNVVLTHGDRDHANGLRAVLEQCTVGRLWINRPWIYAEELLPRFETYNYVDSLRQRLRSIYDATAMLEDIAIKKGIPISAPLQGQTIGAFTVLAPSRSRYLNLIVASEKTPQAVEKIEVSSLFDTLLKGLSEATKFIKSLWGDEYFPSSPTSRDNEMSVVQTALINNKRILLTGDAGREALQEAIDFAPAAELILPGIHTFQVPHHGGRHNVSTEILDKLLGPRLPQNPSTYTWNALCSSARADEDHPRKSVKRAILHRGGHFAMTEGKHIGVVDGIARQNWYPLPQIEYPDEQEE